MNTKRGLSYLLLVVLFTGLVIATLAIVADYTAFFGAGGHFWGFGQVSIKNPLQTPCLYGGIAFLIAFIWSVKIAVGDVKLVRRRQPALNWLLVASTLFAWGNFLPIMFRFYNTPAGQAVIGCTAGKAVVSPWRTYCFGGASMFLLALLIGTLIVGLYIRSNRPVKTT